MPLTVSNINGPFPWQTRHGITEIDSLAAMTVNLETAVDALITYRLFAVVGNT